MQLDDSVMTPVGTGLLRAYRSQDQFCVVVFAWGFGYIHLRDVKMLAQTVGHESKKRPHGNSLEVSHQDVLQQVKFLIENAELHEAVRKYRDGFSTSHVPHQVLLQDCHPQVLQESPNFLRRVQTLVAKLQKRQRKRSIADAEDYTGKDEEKNEDVEMNSSITDEQGLTDRDLAEGVVDGVSDD
jgi:hypothetical protein